MPANYQINVFSPTSGELLHIFDPLSFYDLRYSRVLNDIGALVLTFPADDNLPDLFPLDALVEVNRTSPVTGDLITEETFFCRMTHRFREGNDERFLVGGLSLNHLLSRRVVNPYDDPLQAGGFSTKGGAADTVLREYAYEQMGAGASSERQFANFTIALVEGVGLSVGRRLRFENLFTVFQEIAEQSLMDFQIVRTEGNHLELQIGRRGADKTQTFNYPSIPFVLLNPNRGNLLDPSLLHDRRKEANFLYAMAQGAGENRIIRPYQGDGVGDSPWNRIEFTEDIRTTERNYATEILTEVRRVLKENEQAVEFTFSVSGDQPGTTYREDWDIGDSISVMWGAAYQDLRVRSVEISISERGEELQVTTELL